MDAIDVDAVGDRIAVAIASMWKQALGAHVSILNQEWKVYLDSVDEKNYDIARMGWIASDLDPATFLLIQTTDSGINRTGCVMFGLIHPLDH